MSLIPCLDCNGLISDKTHSCPKCGSSYPFGVQCEVCLKRLPKRAAIPWDPYEDKSCEPWYHFDCLIMTIGFSQPLPCPDCGKDLLVSFRSRKGRYIPYSFHGPSVHIGCEECGGSVSLPRGPLYACRACQLPILATQRWAEDYWTLLSKDHHGLGGDSPLTDFYHLRCVENRNLQIRPKKRFFAPNEPLVGWRQGFYK